MGTHEEPLDIVVCCDGTWCGDSTGTRSNIKLIAEAFAGGKQNLQKKPRQPDGHRFYEPAGRNIRVAYFDGLGNDRGPFASYLLDGALAMNIETACVEGYKYIVDHFTPGSRVWLFGLSRGAFTVRCVAGMINNCGILRKRLIEDQPDLPPVKPEWRRFLRNIFDPAAAAEEELRARKDAAVLSACEQVYNIYRNRDEKYEPNGPFCTEFRLAKSYNCTRPPIRFLGLLDTVGALGLPHLNVGQNLGYEFYNQNVSSEVQTVCQALATHDRLGPFTPCFVRRKRPELTSGQPVPYHGGEHVTYVTEEVWFPGSHYDIGRQRFILFRNNGDVVETGLHYLQAYTNILHLNMNFTKALADPPLRYLLTRVRDTVEQDRLKPLLPNVVDTYVPTAKQEEPPLVWRLRGPLAPLTVDAYDNAAKCVSAKFLRWLPVGGDLVQIIVQKQLLHDRFIPLYRSKPPTGHDPVQAVQQQRLHLQQLQPPPGPVSDQKLAELHQSQEAGNSVRYFYSPAADGTNLLPDVAPYHFHSKAFQAFRSTALPGDLRYIGSDFPFRTPLAVANAPPAGQAPAIDQ